MVRRHDFTSAGAVRDRKPLAATTDAELAISLADRVRRLAPRYDDPEHFHVERDAIATDLARMARRLAGDTGRRREPTTTWRPQPRNSVGS